MIMVALRTLFAVLGLCVLTVTSCLLVYSVTDDSGLTYRLPPTNPALTAEYRPRQCDREREVRSK